MSITVGLYGNLYNTDFNATVAVLAPNSTHVATFAKLLPFLGPICSGILGPEGPDGPYYFSDNFTLPSSAASGTWKVITTVTILESNPNQTILSHASFSVR